MKIHLTNIDNFINNVPDNIRAVLIYGQDRGLCYLRRLAIEKSFLQENKNSNNIIILNNQDIINKPSVIAENFVEDSLFYSGKKILVIREASDKLTKIIKDVLENIVDNNTLIILIAEELSVTSSLRKLIEQHDFTAAIPCYYKDSKELAYSISNFFNKYNISINADGLNFLVNNLGNDSLITLKELQKIALYKSYKSGTLSLEELEKLIGNNSLISLDKLHFSLFNLDVATAYKALEELLNQEGDVFVIRALANHSSRIFYAKQLQEDRSLDLMEINKLLKPPIFFKYQKLFADQLRIWTVDKIALLLGDLIKIELQAKQNNSIGNYLIKNLVINIKEYAS